MHSYFFLHGGWAFQFFYILIPLAIFLILEYIVSIKLSNFVTIVLNAIHYFLIIIFIICSFLFSIQYRPALLLGLSLIFSSLSIFILILMFKKIEISFKSVDILKSLLSAFFTLIFSSSIIVNRFYYSPRDNTMLSIVSVFNNFPQLYFIILTLTLLIYVKGYLKLFLSIPIGVISILMSLETKLPEGHIIKYFDNNIFNGYDFTYTNLLFLVIPLIFIITSIWYYLESKNKSGIFLIVGSIFLEFTFFATFLSFDKYYIYESLVKNTISQGEFILIGIFESLYLIAFAFMGLGLLGFKKKSEQMEATQ